MLNQEHTRPSTPSPSRECPTSRLEELRASGPIHIARTFTADESVRAQFTVFPNSSAPRC